MTELKSQLMKHEGLRLKPYLCTSGKITIGVGRNLEDTGISEEEAMTLLDNDLEWVKAGLDKNIPWWKELDGPRAGVLMNMAFNMGVHGLLKFKKMLGAVQGGNYPTASVEMLDSRWARQVGYRAEELAEQMRTGEWQ